jgi:hypothetical protein
MSDDFDNVPVIDPEQVISAAQDNQSRDWESILETLNKEKSDLLSPVQSISSVRNRLHKEYKEQSTLIAAYHLRLKSNPDNVRTANSLSVAKDRRAVLLSEVIKLDNERNRVSAEIKSSPAYIRKMKEISVAQENLSIQRKYNNWANMSSSGAILADCINGGWQRKHHS